MADIELVIKIPEEIYDYILNEHVRMRVCDSHQVAIAISNGKPLPKGHGRLIDADAVLADPIGNTYKDVDIAETIIEADKKSEGKE